jgi:hypothetical protein
MRPSRGRSLRWGLVGLAFSTLFSSLAGWGVYKIVRASAPPVAVNEDYILTFVDADGRPLSDKKGTLQLEHHPFLLYRNRPNQKTKSYSTDEHGLRGAITTHRPKVFLLGSSAVFGQDLDRDDQTLARQMTRRDPTREYVNGGVVGYLAGQEWGLMLHYADPMKPVGYVLIDGWNEIFDQYHFACRPAGRLGFNNAFFEIENRLAALASGSASAPPFPAPPAPPPRDPATSLAEVISQYLQTVEQMVLFARARGAFFLWAPQPELSRKRTRTDAEERSLEGWNKAYGYIDRGFPAAYGQLVDASRQHAQKTDIPWVDTTLDPAIRDRPETLFLDPVHLSARGNEVLAEVLGRSLDQFDQR